MHTHLSTICLNITLLKSIKQWDCWTYLYFMVYNLWTQYKLVDFHGPVILLHLFLVLWFKIIIIIIILSWEGYKCAVTSEAIKLIFNISKMYLLFYSKLVYFFLYNICTIFFKNILHKISQNYLCITRTIYYFIIIIK